MQKKELAHLHSLVAEIKEYYEEEESNEQIFDDYERLGVSPEHVHKSKSEHKHALFVLGAELAEEMSTDEWSDTGRIAERMREHASEIAAN